ncbi:hypothetical protein B0T20DRAFT_192684 [Sordaria brevicollis]|uniref:DUF4211 domain-containing protein n=1 Tax=Sordaria brevicollis TaxID=83679 RepID=A0AAE0PG37_SORBR|nr:hypothetical protein B0T20DRAFT_192684 [Sordaria brevicollis]
MAPGKKKAKKPKQQTLEGVLGQPRVKPPTIKKKNTSTRSNTTSSPAAAVVAEATTTMATPTRSTRQTRQSQPFISPAHQLPASSAVFMPKISTAEAKKRTIVIDSDSDSDGAAPKIDDYYGKAGAGEEDDLPVFSSQAVVTVTHNPRTPRANSAGQKKKDVVVLDEDDDEDEDDDMPLQSTQRTRGVKRQMAVLSEEDEDEGGDDGQVKGEDKKDEEEDDQSDSDRILSSAVRRRATRRGGEKLESSPAKKRRLISRRPSASSPAKVEEEESDIDISGVKEEDEDEDEEDVKPHRLGLGRGRLTSSFAAADSADESTEPPVRANKRRVKKRMTEKEKARELLRRKRAGEPIDDLLNDEEEDDESEVELPKKGYYDTDSDNPALSEFEDEETGEEEAVVKDEKKRKDKKKIKKKDKKKDKKRREISPDSEDTEDDERNGNAGGSYEDEEMQDFIAEDDSDAPIGAPDEFGIPIEFTRHAHKPLKEHFRDVVEWLVHYKVHPDFREKKEELYRLGWRKLDDEVRGLAQSKFASSAWKTDFYMALRARPYYTSGETHEESFLADNCAACGRSGHPAKFEIAFSGSPYYKDFSHPRFLEPVPNSNSPAASADSEEEDVDDYEYDADGNTIPAPSRHWKIGSVCHSNAETAHSLLHWQYALLDWVDTRLSEEGHLAAAGAISKKRKEGETKEERKKRVTKKKYKLVAKVVSEWEAEGTVKALFREFKSMLEEARNKSTAGPRAQKGWAK